MKLLMNRELSDTALELITEISFANPGLWGIHDGRTRSSSINSLVQSYLDIDCNLILREAHSIIEAVLCRVMSLSHIATGSNPLEHALTLIYE